MAVVSGDAQSFFARSIGAGFKSAAETAATETTGEAEESVLSFLAGEDFCPCQIIYVG